MQGLQLSEAPPLDGALAEDVARTLHRAAVAWAGTFLRSRAGLDPALLAQLATETLAFGLALLKARLRWRGAAGIDWAAQVSRAAWSRHARWQRPRRLARRLGAAAATRDDSPHAKQGLPLASSESAERDGAAFEFTDAMVAEFCELTGLGTREVVGDGANRAAVGFYLVVHGRVFARRPDSREERRWLIEAMRDCRQHLERAVDHWLSAPVARPSSARIGR